MATISRLRKSLTRNDTGLILFDALHGYLHPSDPKKVAFLEERNILKNLQRLLAGARRAGLTTFYPSGAHAADGSDTVERLTDTDMNLQPLSGGDKPITPHIRKGSKDQEIAAELTPAPGDVLGAEKSLELVLSDQSRTAIAGARHRHHHHRWRLDRRRHRQHGFCRARHGSGHRGRARLPAIRCAATTMTSSWTASFHAWAAS